MNRRALSLYYTQAIMFYKVGTNRSKDCSTSENSHSVIATSFHTEAPTSTQNKRLRASRTPMRKYCHISQKAGCAVLYATQSNIRKRVLRNTELFFCLVCYTKETLEERNELFNNSILFLLTTTAKTRYRGQYFVNVCSCCFECAVAK